MQFNTGSNPDANKFGSGKAGYRISAPFSTAEPATQNAILGELGLAVEAFVALNPAAYNQLATILTTLLSNAGGSSTLQQSASTPVFATPNDSQDHPSSSSNRWKLLLRAPMPDGTFVRLYVGDDTGDPGGSWVFTNNAVWSPASGDQFWSKDNTGQASMALLAQGTTLRWLVRASGAGTWTTGWTSGEGDAAIGGDLVASTIGVTGTSTVIDQSGGTLRVNGELNVNGDLFATDDVIATDDFLYAAPQSRTTIVPVASAVVANGTVSYSGGRLTADAAVSFTWPIEKPAGATLSIARVIVNKAGGGSAVFQAIHQDTINFGAPSAPSGTVVDSDNTSSSGLVTLIVDFGNLTVDESDDYSLILSLPDAGDQVYAVDISWMDPGPRNR